MPFITPTIFSGRLFHIVTKEDKRDRKRGKGESERKEKGEGSRGRKRRDRGMETRIEWNTTKTCNKQNNKSPPIF